MLTATRSHRGKIVAGLDGEPITLGYADRIPHALPARWGGTPVAGPFMYVYDHQNLPDGTILEDGTIILDEES